MTIPARLIEGHVVEDEDRRGHEVASRMGHARRFVRWSKRNALDMAESIGILWAIETLLGED